ncbi:MAG: VOC family protein [Terriglobales bacterium]
MKFLSIYNPWSANSSCGGGQTAAMGELVDDFTTRGTLLATGMLQPDRQGGLLVQHTGSSIEVSDTPGTLAATVGKGCGFAVLETESRDEAIGLTKQFLQMAGGGECELCGIQEPALGLVRHHGSPQISPFLWFKDNAEAAVAFYLSIFPASKKLSELRNSGDAPGPRGGILTIDFELNGERFTALNGGPEYQFSPAVSFVVSCRTQQEIDYYWARLTDGGTEIQCGWLQDRFGLSWQVVPANIFELLRSSKAMQAMLQMKKMDIAVLEAAAKS